MNLLHRPPGYKKLSSERTKIQKQTRKDMFESYVREDTSASAGMLTAINSLTLDTDISKHTMFEKAPGTVLPQFFSVSLDFFVIHEDTIGFDNMGNSLLPNYPYDVWLKEPSDAEAGRQRLRIPRQEPTCCLTIKLPKISPKRAIVD